MDLHVSRPHILRYWAGTPDQHRQTNRLYRRMRIGAAQRELSRNNGERFLAPGYACVTRADWLRRYHDTVLPKGARFWYKGEMGYDDLEKSARAQPRTRYTRSAFWTTRGRLNFDGSRTRLLVPASSHRQCASSGDPTYRRLISRRDRGQLTFKPPPLLVSSPSFSGLWGLEFLPLGCWRCFERFFTGRGAVLTILFS